jgi:hypothetical protein
MSKILIKTLIISVVTGVVLLILLMGRSPFGKSNSLFATGQDNEITRIELSSSGMKLILEKKGETWLINGKTEARKSAILFIQRILTEIKIKSPVSQGLFESEVEAKNIVPVKVRVFENRRLLRTFLVYKTLSNSYGNIMKMRESSKPFIVYIPGYEGNIGSAFITNELYWQPYIVFNLLPSEIASVTFENFTDTASSFKITKKDQQYFLSHSVVNFKGWDSSLVVRYISYFARIPFESWVFDLTDSEKRSIEESQPLYRITVITTRNGKNILNLWALQTGENGSKKTDSDKLLGKTDKNDGLFVMRYFDIDPLIKKRSYFFPQ